jgi:Ala-tRNA(Pro) deacylase
VLAADHVELATEKEFSHRFPRCEVGAMPPFGHLYGLETYMVPVFDTDGLIAFNAGTHTEVLLMPLSEYLRVAHVTEVAGGVIPPGFISAKIQRGRHCLLH